MPGHEVRYCTTEDGIRIAYCVEGEGYPVLACPMFIESFSLEHLVPERQAFMRRLGLGRMLIRYDMRGTGLSARAVTDLSPQALVLDVQAVADALHLERFALFALTVSGPRAIRYAAAYPERVSHLILYGTAVRLIRPAAELRTWAELARTSWDVAAQTFADLSLRQEFAEPAARIAEQYRRSASGDVVAELIVQNAERDVRPLLSSVRAQSLILHRLEDALYPSEQAQELAAGIPNSRLVALQGSAHEFALDDTEPIHTAIDDFLPERTVAVAERFQAGAMVSVLFTDLVGHVEMMQRLGDAKGRDVLRDHEAITRDVLKKHGGAELKTSGDGFMASFASMTSAVECAVALQRAFAERNKAADEPLHVRVGLNAGEPIAEDGDLFGATVILAARIAAYAGAGEILIPELLRHLLAGKGFFFGDRGDFLPKGFEEPVRLLEVRWQDGAKAKSAP